MSAIDPGIEEPIRTTANDNNEEDKRDEQETDDYKAPGTWWFASTICPLLAATFGPIANGFSICALVYTWRSYVPPGLQQASGKSIRDPSWLIAINAVSLACALIGNAALLLNMAKRVRFAIAQPITIAGFFLAGILLVADMAALSSSSTYFLTDSVQIQHHVLTGAFYYAIWAASIYIVIAMLACLTVHGARKGHYSSGFNLTPAQRTLMLQTMMFIGYLLLGALVFSSIEGWKYLDGVYWAQVTLLTVGLGDYSPTKPLSRGLLFPYAIVGVLTVGLVVGSIRTLVLERGKQKIAARITEKRREAAIHNVNERKQTIKTSWFAQAEFHTDPSLTPAQRREEEFHIMRKVQRAAERERRYFALSLSLFFVLLLWFVGAAVFMVCEQHEQGWTYFQALYFTFVALMTIGYGDLTPQTNAGKAFFVFWSLLAVPSLTILISNMGDTFVKWFSDLTNWVASFTILPERNKSKSSNSAIRQAADRATSFVSGFTAPGLLGGTSHSLQRMDGDEHHLQMMKLLANRLERHISEEELQAAKEADAKGDDATRDVHFYHYVLSRELRNVQHDVNESPPKKYPWPEWEYYLRLIGNGDDPKDFEGQEVPNILAPEALRVSGAVKRFDNVPDRDAENTKEYTSNDNKKLERRAATDSLANWSWLSDQSPLMSTETEAEWILERLSAALERELHAQRKGVRRRPPIGMRHAAWLRSN